MWGPNGGKLRPSGSRAGVSRGVRQSFCVAGMGDRDMCMRFVEARRVCQPCCSKKQMCFEQVFDQSRLEGPGAPGASEEPFGEPSGEPLGRPPVSLLEPSEASVISAKGSQPSDLTQVVSVISVK